jgi:hypothetical protein
MMTTDRHLPGYTDERGPRGERIGGEYVTPAILDDAASLGGRVWLRVRLLADCLLASDRRGSDWLAHRLLRVSLGRQPDDVWVVPLPAVDTARLRRDGGTVREGPGGAYVVVTHPDG